MVTRWADIDGWLSPEEGETLQCLALDRVVLELGSYLGRSTVCLASVASHVTAVDWHRGDTDTGPTDTLQRFLSNLVAAEVAGRVSVIAERIEEAGPDLPDASYDVVFIDGQHDAVSVERDTRLALRCCKPGGTIVWHDWSYSTVQAGIAACDLEPTDTMVNLAWMTGR